MSIFKDQEIILDLTEYPSISPHVYDAFIPSYEEGYCPITVSVVDLSLIHI